MNDISITSNYSVAEITNLPQDERIELIYETLEKFGLRKSYAIRFSEDTGIIKLVSSEKIEKESAIDKPKFPTRLDGKKPLKEKITEYKFEVIEYTKPWFNGFQLTAPETVYQAIANTYEARTK